MHPRCANAHNCLGLTLGRWWNTVSFDIHSSASPCLIDLRDLRVIQYSYYLLHLNTYQATFISNILHTRIVGQDARTMYGHRKDRQTWIFKYLCILSFDLLQLCKVCLGCESLLIFLHSLNYIFFGESRIIRKSETKNN